MEKMELEEKLIVGAKIRLGKQFAEWWGLEYDGKEIELIEGHFEYDNGLYTEDQTAPSIYDTENEEFNSIYHLFGNDFENFMDCEVVE